MSKKIKLFNYLVLSVDNEEHKANSYTELWEMLGWDIENDPEADKCSSIICRELFCFGYIDISALTNHEHKVEIYVR